MRLGADKAEPFARSVREALRILGRGVLHHPDNHDLRQAFETRTLPPEDLRDQAMRLLCNVVCLCVLEERNALPDPSCTRAERERYRRSRSLVRLRTRALPEVEDKQEDLWSDLQQVFTALGRRQGEPEQGLPALGGSLFPNDETGLFSRCRLYNRDLLLMLRSLFFRQEEGRVIAVDFASLPLESLGNAYAWLLELDPTTDIFDQAEAQERGTHARRATGSYYTPRELIEIILDLTLEPLLERACRGADPESELLALRVCDPACGGGNFLLAAARRLAERLWRVQGGKRSPEAHRAAFRQVLAADLYGVDLNPTALELGKAALGLEGYSPGEKLPSLSAHLRCGNSLLGVTPKLLGADGGLAVEEKLLAAADQWCRDVLTPGQGRSGRRPEKEQPFVHWHLAFPEVFCRRTDNELANPATGWYGGFDVVLGNPPWIAHAGRAAQRLPPELQRFYLRTNPAFAGYRTTHGLFVYLGASLLREEGRLGLVVPTSVSDLEGYRAVRIAHDQLCEVVPELPDFGDVFAGVFQPCMGLVSLRKSCREGGQSEGEPWELARRDLCEGATALLRRLTELPRLPASLFGERGLQTTAELRKGIERIEQAQGRFSVPLREGADIQEFKRGPPRHYADPQHLEGKLRVAGWQEVSVLIRQTARWTIAAASDGMGFRNSLLAGFEREGWTWQALLGLLNSTLIRWYHYNRFRDARQGMPQVKIGHLRQIPAPLGGKEEQRKELEALGQQLGERNTGIKEQERARLDELVAELYDLRKAEQELVAAWWAAQAGRG